MEQGSAQWLCVLSKHLLSLGSASGSCGHSREADSVSEIVVWATGEVHETTTWTALPGQRWDGKADSNAGGGRTGQASYPGGGGEQEGR